MKRVACIIVIFATGMVSAAFAQTTDANRAWTEHLIIEWKEGAVGDEGLEAAKTLGEKFYAVIRNILGYDANGKIMIILEGPAEQPDGTWGYPHVDSFGRIHLYQFGPTYDSYFSALAHEMVHVFRFNRKPHHDWFFEEGFAEFVALRVDPSLQGFPWYDTAIVVAAGQWLGTSEEIPLQALREKHRALNLPCKAQSYTLRSHFFVYLGDTYGDETVLKLSQQERAGELSDYHEFFGKDFDTLVAEWREALLAVYKATENVEELSRRYREDTPMQYMPVCQKGEEF